MGSRSILLFCTVYLAVVRSQEAQQQQPPKPIIKSLNINSDIKYTYAKTYVSSKILNPAEVAQEVNFRVVLPEEAFITGLVMTIKGKSYDAYIKEKEEAKKEYDQAVSSGQGAAHVFQNSRFSKDFTVSVNVEPQEKVHFNLTYEELLSRKNKTYQNTINVNPNEIVDDLSIVVNIEDVLEVINVDVEGSGMNNAIDGSDEGSVSAQITRTAPNKVHVEWKPSTEDQIKLNKEGINGQMIVKYDVNASANPQQILVDSDGYFVHILRNDQLPVLNKHVVFVLDVSGSMSGPKIDQLKDAMKKILLDLSESDYFSIVLFSVKVVAWGPGEDKNVEILNGWEDLEPANVIAKDDYIIPATPSNVDAALNFTKTIFTYGGTNIMGGLRNGLKLAKKGKQLNANSALPVESMIIFLTDGEPNSEESDPDKITEKVVTLNEGVTIFSLAFGDDADLKFLKKLSLSNGGFARKIYADSDASIQLQNFYKEVASPVLSDIKFEYLPEQVENATSKGFKNLFSGSEVLVLGKVKPNGNVSGVLTAKSRNGEQRFDIPIDQIIVLPKEENKTLGHLEKMWAYKTIKTLLEKNTISKNESIENKAKELALKYSFVTPLTSLVVVKPNDTGEINDEESNGRRTPYFGGGGFGGGGYGVALASYPSSGAPGSAFILAAPSPPFAHPGSPVPPSAPDFATVAIKEDAEMSTFSNDNTTSAFNKIPYQSISWLNQTATEDGYLIPPSSLQTTDVIALNETDVTNSHCADGNPCRHFIYCALAEFSDDVTKFLPFKCHIETKFVGVCCPQ